MSPIKSFKTNEKRKLRSSSSSTATKENILSPSKRSPPVSRQIFTSTLSEISSCSVNPNEINCFKKARMVLSTTEPEILVGREKQLREIENFLTKSNKRSLYISGAPGTGKTACLSYLLKCKGESYFGKCVFVNCMTLKSLACILRRLCVELGNKQKMSGEREAKKWIEKTITASNSKPILLVLDEIDQLEGNRDILYTVFEWPHMQGSKIKLVGIANALDLTDRILPRLKLRRGICPEHISFPAYTRDEIYSILMMRLAELRVQVIKPAALQFLSGKIAALSGDIRTALDVCRRALELAEIEAKKIDLPILVDVSHVLKVFVEIYGSQAISSLKEKANLPLVQKLLLASLLLMTKQTCKEVLLSKLYQTYVNVCKKRNMVPVSESECVSLCALLESRGLLGMRNSGNEPRLAKVCLKIDEREVETALEDKTLLHDILRDDFCMSK